MSSSFHKIADYSHMIGRRVRKPSGKPFKSTFKVNTVSGVVKNNQNPHRPDIDWFTFEEDDSVVEAWRCVDVTGALYDGIDLRDKHVVVMFSGGPDSVYLYHTLRACTRNVSLLFINYTNTPAAPDAEANLKFVMDFAYEYDVMLEVYTIDIGRDYDRKKGPEGNCRLAKKDIINQVIARDGVDYVMVGHNYDDHIETILIQLMRGAGRGTRGIPDRVVGKLVRPLVYTKKQDILAECAQAGWYYFTDIQNANTTCTRQFMRHRIIPLLVEHYGSGAYSRICNIGKKFEEV
jgi:tRNA(Ile)-lysidine synthetase-like protein